MSSKICQHSSHSHDWESTNDQSLSQASQLSVPSVQNLAPDRTKVFRAHDFRTGRTRPLNHKTTGLWDPTVHWLAPTQELISDLKKLRMSNSLQLHLGWRFVLGYAVPEHSFPRPMKYIWPCLRIQSPVLGRGPGDFCLGRTSPSVFMPKTGRRSRAPKDCTPDGLLGTPGSAHVVPPSQSTAARPIASQSTAYSHHSMNQLKGNVNFRHICTIETSLIITFSAAIVHPFRSIALPSTTSKYIFKYNLQVYSITASKCISRCALPPFPPAPDCSW